MERVDRGGSGGGHWSKALGVCVKSGQSSASVFEGPVGFVGEGGSPMLKV